MPVKPAAVISGRSRSRGRRGRVQHASTSSAAPATASRDSDSPTAPSSGAATRMAGKALAQRITTEMPAAKPRERFMPRVSEPRYQSTSESFFWL
jgi:hypothetical protein